MKIPKLTTDLSVISKLGDNPGADNDLTAAGLKAKFDEAGLTIQQYINEEIVDPINDMFSEDVPAHQGMTMLGPIDMNEQKLVGLEDPSTPTEAVSFGFAEGRYAPLSHVSDTNNPHAVTAEQVGARPNAWLPTIAEIGAAPAGYGLGSNDPETLTTLTQLDNFKVSGWRRVYLSSGTVEGSSIGTLCVDAGDRYIRQTFFSQYDIWGGYYALTRVWENGSSGGWQPWEWINPPMIAGTEYRTTQRYLGKPVYAKLVDLGSLPSASSKSISHGIANVENVVSITGQARQADGTKFTFPFIRDPAYPTSSMVYIHANTTNAILGQVGSVYSSSYAAYAIIKVTKTTD